MQMPKKFVDKLAVLAIPLIFGILFWVAFKVATTPEHCRCHSCDERVCRLCHCKQQDCGDKNCPPRPKLELK